MQIVKLNNIIMFSNIKRLLCKYENMQIYIFSVKYANIHIFS